VPLFFLPAVGLVVAGLTVALIMAVQRRRTRWPAQPPFPGPLPFSGAPAPAAPPAHRGPGGLEVTAMLLLLLGGFMLLVGWVAGCVLLWVSPRWRWPGKLLGTLVWPAGLLAPWVAAGWAGGGESCSGGTGLPSTCTATGPPGWVSPVLWAAMFICQVAVTVRLWRHAGRQPVPAGTAR
jgi:hypothetical protein